MKRYAEFKPTGFDCKGLGLDDQQDWLVHPCGTNRDANALTRSNFEVSVRDLEKLDPDGNDHEVHRFGHWACGWFEIIIVRPETPCAADAESTEAGLADYPVCCDSHFSETEEQEALKTWQNCYNDRERLEYIRDNWSQFDSCRGQYNRDKCEGWRRLLANVRGKDFCGYASDLLG